MVPDGGHADAPSQDAFLGGGGGGGITVDFDASFEGDVPEDILPGDVFGDANLEDVGPCCYTELCPDGVDPECPFVCGDGRVDPEYELCDGDCPTSCPPPSTEMCAPVVNRFLGGDPALCNVECFDEPRGCVDGDACCLEEQFCYFFNDSDCPEPEGDIGTPCAGDDDCNGAEEAFCLTQDDTGYLGGYCTIDPVEVLGCPDGSHPTVDLTGDTTLYCGLDCESDDDCERTGYTCHDQDFDGTTECTRAGIGETPLGEACEGHWTCAGGDNVRCTESVDGELDAACTQFCSTDEDPSTCPDGTTCFGARCLEDGSLCGMPDGICPDIIGCDFRIDDDCEEVVFEVGAACARDADCGTEPNAICLTPEDGFVDGFCTLAGTDTPPSCPDGARIAALFLDAETTMYICVQDCDGDGDCPRAGYACYDRFIDGSDECGPLASGPGSFGDACSSIDDCGGGEHVFCGPDGTCTQACQPETVVCRDPDAACPLFSFVEGCAQRCDGGRTCPPGLDCSDFFGAQDPPVCTDDGF